MSVAFRNRRAKNHRARIRGNTSGGLRPLGSVSMNSPELSRAQPISNNTRAKTTPGFLTERRQSDRRPGARERDRMRPDEKAARLCGAENRLRHVPVTEADRDLCTLQMEAVEAQGTRSRSTRPEPAEANGTRSGALVARGTMSLLSGPSVANLPVRAPSTPFASRSYWSLAHWEGPLPSGGLASSQGGLLGERRRRGVVTCCALASLLGRSRGDPSVVRNPVQLHRPRLGLHRDRHAATRCGRTSSSPLDYNGRSASMSAAQANSKVAGSRGVDFEAFRPARERRRTRSSAGGRALLGRFTKLRPDIPIEACRRSCRGATR